jgi:hypothetical protein
MLTVATGITDIIMHVDTMFICCAFDLEVSHCSLKLGWTYLKIEVR